MENNILLHRRAVQQNIMKSFDSDFESFDELEKGKWNVGDTKVYQGVTWEVGGFNAKGAPLWRKAKGGSGSGASSSQNNTTSSTKISDDNVDSNPSVTDKTLHNTLREMALTGTIRNLKGVSQKRRGEILDELEKRGFIDKHMNLTKNGTAWLSGLKQSTQNTASSDKKNDKLEEDKIYSRLRVLESRVKLGDISEDDWNRSVSIMRQTDPNKISAVQFLTEDKVSDKFLATFREVANHLFLTSGKNESESDRWRDWRYLATGEMNERILKLNSDLDKLLKNGKNTPLNIL